MPFSDLIRHMRDDVWARERLRRANRQARISSTVLFRGDVELVRLGRGVSIAGPTVLWAANGPGLNGALLTVGDRTYIGEFNNIRCGGTVIAIGSDCLISQHVTIVGSNHRMDPRELISSQNWSGAGVRVGDGAWVGAGAVILSGSVVGDGAVVAAGSVVRGVVAPGEVVGGVPARPLRRRPAMPRN